MGKMKDLLREDTITKSSHYVPDNDVVVIVEPIKASGFLSTDVAKRSDPALVQFILALADPQGELSREKNFQTRLDHAISQTGASPEIMSNQATLDLLHYYLSYYLYNTKYQRLVVKQIQLWNLCRRGLDDVGTDDVKKQVDTHDAITDLIDKLAGQIDTLYSEIYGAPEIQAIARDQVKQSKTPEQRLKDKKLKEEATV